jgi:hypothetical protein
MRSARGALGHSGSRGATRDTVAPSHFSHSPFQTLFTKQSVPSTHTMRFLTTALTAALLATVATATLPTVTVTKTKTPAGTPAAKATKADVEANLEDAAAAVKASIDKLAHIKDARPPTYDFAVRVWRVLGRKKQNKGRRPSTHPSNHHHRARKTKCGRACGERVAKGEKKHGGRRSPFQPRLH